MAPIIAGVKALQWSYGILSYFDPNAPSLFGSLTLLLSLTILIALIELRVRKPALVDPVPPLQLPSGEATSVLTFAHSSILTPSLPFDTGFPHVRYKVLFYNSLRRSDIKINSLSPGGDY